jgi:hypothetical protein
MEATQATDRAAEERVKRNHRSVLARRLSLRTRSTGLSRERRATTVTKTLMNRQTLRTMAQKVRKVRTVDHWTMDRQEQK